MRFPLDEEQRKKVRGMDIEPLAKLAFLYLKNKHGSYTSDPSSVCSVEHVRTQLFPSAQYNSRPARSDYTRLFEAITLLERRGLVIMDIRHLAMPNDDYNTFFLTSIGEKSEFHAGVLLLVDKPEEIVREVEQTVGNLDSVVRQYYLESLRAFQAELYILSVIGLGVASERAIYWLAESIESWSPKYREELETEKKNPISKFTDHLHDNVIRKIPRFDKRFQNELKDQLKGLAALYRKNRNKAGHPDAVDQSWSREDQQVLLVGFRGYIATICEAIKRLKNNGNV